jgi:hypothetical protein
LPASVIRLPENGKPCVLGRGAGLTQGKAGQENLNVIRDLLPRTHNSYKASQNRHEPGLLQPRTCAIWGKGNE